MAKSMRGNLGAHLEKMASTPFRGLCEDWCWWKEEAGKQRERFKEINYLRYVSGADLRCLKPYIYWKLEE